MKNVVANQPIRRGGSRCTEHCDTENHHVHMYCTLCKRNLHYGTVAHDCVFGMEKGQLHPDMKPEYLINKPWWKDPFLVQASRLIINPAYLLYLTSLYYNVPISTPSIPELD